MNDIIEKLLTGASLTTKEATQTMHLLLDEQTPSSQKAATLVLLRSKGETATELGACLDVLRANMQSISLPYPVIDFVGTGGDRLHTVNISTASALLAAACDLPTLKHGNRAMSSLAGSADVLAALDINIHSTAAQTQESIAQHHFGFCFAPNYHPALKQLAELRKQIKVSTLFNLLGPLLNPAPKVHLILGVADPKLVDTYATLLTQKNTPRSVIIHQQGLDELTCLGPAQLIEINGQHATELFIDPESLGLKRCRIEDLSGKDAQYNAAYIRQTFSGEETGLSDTLILNAALGLYLYHENQTLSDAMQIAREALRSGKAEVLLAKLINS